jgi:hypothetical protein
MVPAITLFSQLNSLAANMNLFSLINEHGITALEEKQTQLDELMTLESAASRWPQLFKAIELRRAARAGQIRHIHKGRKRLISEHDLMDWLHQKEIGPSCRRRSLKTTDIEEAKRLLATHAVTAKHRDPLDPEQIMLVVILTHYYENHSDSKPSAHAAKRAGVLVMEFLESECGFGANVKVAQFTKGLQAKFAQWSVEKFQHTPSYISRNLSVIAAACRFATKTIVKRTTYGQFEEIRILRLMPEICFDVKWLAEMTDRPEPKPRDYVPIYEYLASLLDVDGSELLRRYNLIALNTWARPEAIPELSARAQVDFENSLIDLNPPNRKQNKKRRPVIKLTENLRGWFEFWSEDKPLSYDRKKSKSGVTKIERSAATHTKAQFKRRVAFGSAMARKTLHLGMKHLIPSICVKWQQ